MILLVVIIDMSQQFIVFCKLLYIFHVICYKYILCYIYFHICSVKHIVSIQ